MGKYTWNDVPMGYVIEIKVDYGAIPGKSIVYQGMEFTGGTYGIVVCRWIEWEFHIKLKGPKSWDNVIETLIGLGYCLHHTRTVKHEGNAKIYTAAIVKSLGVDPDELRRIYTEEYPPPFVWPDETEKAAILDHIERGYLDSIEGRVQPESAWDVLGDSGDDR